MENNFEKLNIKFCVIEFQPRSPSTEITVPSLNGGPIFKGVTSPRECNGTTRFTEASRASMKTWSEFASWNHLNNDAPYW